MISISDKSLCCGCTACVAACPAQCIVMRRDREGFDYPVANPDLCIGCGKCEKVCPVLSPAEPVQAAEAYAVRIDEHVAGSSSGGVFPALAGEVIADGGVVFGAVVNPDMTVGHAEAQRLEDVEKMRGSKYIQSDLYASFEDVKYYLEQGRSVLFSGTPCQVAGLNAFLSKKYDNLLTVDLACHGVPSPGLWEKYVQALERKYGKKMDFVQFRDKSESWRRYSFATTYGKVRYVRDPYMALFVQDMTLRPSCYKCPVREGRSGSDLTLADLWSVASTAPVLDDDKGVSGVLVMTCRGREALDRISCKAHIYKVDCADVRKNNGGFAGTIAAPQKREEFFKGVHSADDIIKYFRSYVVRRPVAADLYKELRASLSRMKRRIMR